MENERDVKSFETLDGYLYGENPEAGKTIRLVPFGAYHERSDPVIEVLHNGKLWQAFSWSGVKMVTFKQTENAK